MTLEILTPGVLVFLWGGDCLGYFSGKVIQAGNLMHGGGQGFWHEALKLRKTYIHIAGFILFQGIEVALISAAVGLAVGAF